MIDTRERRPSASELMVVAAAREIRDGELVFVGMRLPLLAFRLAKSTHAKGAIGLFENGLVRTEAAADPLYTMSDPGNQIGALCATSLLDVMGFLQSGRVGLGFVGAAEVDRFGNLNSTRVSSGGGGIVRLPGSGGASDIASLASRLVVLLPHRRHRLVPRVHYLTSPGHGDGGEWRADEGLTGGGPSAIITDRGVLRFDPHTREAVLASFHPLFPTSSADDVVAQTGWPLRASRDCGPTPLPTEEETSILRTLDPNGFWLRKEQDR